MNAAIVVAAGSGQRFGFKEEKPFVLLAGRPILIYTLTLFEQIREIDAVVLVVSGRKIAEAGEMAGQNGCRKVSRIVAGGATRQDSVACGLAVLPAATEIVLIHDAARPLISAGKVVELICAAQKSGAVIPVVPVSDTLKRVEQGIVRETVDRSSFYAVQTPQVFARRIIAAAYQKAAAGGWKVTDDASLVEAAGFPVTVIPGERANIKITYPEDLLLAAALLAGGSPSA